MTRRELNMIGAAVRSLRKRATVFSRCGHTSAQKTYEGWADCIHELVRQIPKGCSGCAYENSKNGRCVDCARVRNRTDNFRRKFV